MKSLFKGYISIAILLAASFLAACGDDEKEEVVIDTSEPTLEVLTTETAFNFTSAGNVAKVLQFTTNRDWQVVRGEGDSSWLTLFERTGKAGEGIKVWVAAAENTDTEGRSTSFTLQSGGHTEKFTVYQAQKDAIIISDPESYKELPSGEQVIELEFATNAGEFGVTYSFGTGITPWIAEEVDEDAPETRALVNHKLRFKVEANPTYVTRIATLNVVSVNTEAKAQITITQQGTLKPEITIVNKADFKSVSSAKTILPLKIETNVENLDDLEVVVPDKDKEWVSVGKNADETGYELTVAGNTLSARSSTITVRSAKDNAIKDEVKLSQASAPGVVITITNKDDYEKEQKKEGTGLVVEYEILIDSWDVEISYANPDNAGWLEEKNRSVPGKIYFAMDENKVLKPRSATVTIYDKTNPNMKDEVTIVQAAATCVEMQEGWTLQQTLAAYGLDETVESLELKGALSNSDWALLKTMGKVTLKHLDLSAITNTTIPNGAFTDCAQLETLVFPQHGNLKEIPAEVCRRCSSLKEVRIPEGVDIIVNHAFATCSRLTAIYLPSTITYLYGYCFEQCTSIKDIHLKSKPIQVFNVWRSPSQPTVMATVFNNNNLPKKATLYVPSEYVDLYKNPTPANCVSKNLQEELDKNAWSAKCDKGWFSWTDASTVVKGEN